MKKKIVLILLYSFIFFVGCTNAEIENTQQSTQQSELITDVDKFTTWDNRAIHLYEAANIFDSLSLAEYVIDGTTFWHFIMMILK